MGAMPPWNFIHGVLCPRGPHASYATEFTLKLTSYSRPVKMKSGEIHYKIGFVVYFNCLSIEQ